MREDSFDGALLFGGVYGAIEHQLMIGPYTHAETFATKPAGFRFAKTKLPALANRYVISCLLPTSALPAPQPSATSSVTHSSEKQEPPTETADPAADALPLDTKAAVAQLSSKAADFVAQMNARRQQQQLKSSAGSPSTTAGLPLAFSRSVEKARGLRAERQGGTAVFSKAGAPESVVRQLAQENDDIRRAVEGGLGEGHFLQCALMQDSLEDVLDVQEAVEFISKAFSHHPDSVVYVYSASGRNRASAVAMYYLQRVQQMPLNIVFARLPTSTPQISYLKTLIAQDARMHGDGKPSFDEEHYFFLYFTRRYPQKASSLIRAAIETCPGDFERADKLLHDQYVFASGGAQPASLLTPTSGELQRPADSGSFGSANRSKRAPGAAGGARSSSSSPPPFSGDVSFSSGSADDGGPVALTALDLEIVETVCRALQKANVPASHEDVKASYVRNRRNQNRVLREFLAKDGVQAAGKVDLEQRRTPVVSLQRSAAAGSGSRRT